MYMRMYVEMTMNHELVHFSYLTIPRKFLLLILFHNTNEMAITLTSISVHIRFSKYLTGPIGFSQICTNILQELFISEFSSLQNVYIIFTFNHIFITIS